MPDATSPEESAGDNRPANPGINDPGGFVVVDKQAGWTSHDVVARCRRLLGTRKVGHAGTLDPDATGVLIVGIGRATRLLRFASDLKKTYVGEIVLGVSTTTLDAAGQVTGLFDMEAVTLEDLRAAALSLTGRIEQIPPMVSAVKVGGRRLHELARAGIEVERAPRPVEVFRFEVFETGDRNCYRVLVECSSGTYVRVLAADLGARLGGGAHLRALRRVAVGSFTDSEALKLEEVAPERMRPPEELVRDLAGAVASPELSEALGHGRAVERVALGAVGDGPWSVVDEDGKLVAICEPLGRERIKPIVVIQPASGSSSSSGSLAGDE
ncbi:MAG: tRNA pseudouridine(55) synthase TruB [Acidimicrobiales bacterium]